MRHRWMYYATGLPGWMRFGYSPGWVGRSPSGLGPGAEFIMTGRWPTPQMASWVPGQWPFGPGAAAVPEAELSALKAQAEALRAQLEAIAQRIEEIEGKE